jgi:ubiquinone/menaquinone biosynthesis C-methylase UbiE
VTISFDKAAEDYDRTRNLKPRVMDAVIAALSDELDNCGPILDLGAGTGRFTKPLQGRGVKVVGIDISNKMLCKARERGTSNLVNGDVLELPFKDSKFDACLSVHLLHLIKDWTRALKEVARVSKHHFLTISHEGPEFETTPSGVYKRLLEELGYSYDHPGLSEVKLKQMVIPEKRRFILSYMIDVPERISTLEEKQFSFQWGTPNELHEIAIAKLKEKFSGKVQYSTDIYLYIWNIDKIRGLLNDNWNGNFPPAINFKP